MEDIRTATREDKSRRAFRVFFIPFFATSHIVPAVDLAWQFAARGVDSTVLITPANTPLVRRTVDRAHRAGLPLRLLTYPFPAAEVGLPEGLENLSTVSPSDEEKIYRATNLAQASHDHIIRESRPHAVIADVWFPTTVADDLGIPRVTFHVVSIFSQCVMYSLLKSRAHDKLAGPAADSTPFVVPYLPDPVEMVRSELPVFLRRPNHLAENIDRLKKVSQSAYGVVVNTFYELEEPYVDLYRASECRRAWLVGPLSLLYGRENEMAAVTERGGDESSASNEELCMAWLKTQAPASVVFVCFGSWNHFSEEQLREMALGLEATGVPFLWAVREEHWERATEWAPSQFEKRLAGRGLVVRGWAPQAAILSHPAVGAFLTHCGWNSVTEGVAAGLPMITWPLVFDHFIIERLVVGLLQVGVKMYGGFRSTLREEAAKVVVGREVIAQVVARFVPGVDEEIEGMRRARALAASAKAAVEGGTSYRDLNSLIEGLMSYRAGC
ncbi:hypothetical protein Taro_051893 [Colocasia esculenta]|uniref:Glycosyltransferase n=1 Tax=Colocasia esculenta TaxID=4460 RepID=A0A843XI40_COLES|nr:hypothetical protein [Colocasia esculenta]